MIANDDVGYRIACCDVTVEYLSCLSFQTRLFVLTAYAVERLWIRRMWTNLDNDTPSELQ